MVLEGGGAPVSDTRQAVGSGQWAGSSNQVCIDLLSLCPEQLPTGTSSSLPGPLKRDTEKELD